MTDQQPSQGGWAPPAGPPPSQAPWQAPPQQAPPQAESPSWPAGATAAPAGAATPAEWWRRAVALIIDSVVIGAPMGLLFGIVAVAVFGTADTDPVTGDPEPGAGGLLVLGLLYVLSVVVPFVYQSVLNGGERGATLGKRAMSIQVRDATTGGPIGVGKGFLRTLVYSVLWWAFLIPGFLNVLSPLWDSRRQAWHDKAVNSVVVNS